MCSPRPCMGMDPSWHSWSAAGAMSEVVTITHTPKKDSLHSRLSAGHRSTRAHCHCHGSPCTEQHSTAPTAASPTQGCKAAVTCLPSTIQRKRWYEASSQPPHASLANQAPAQPLGARHASCLAFLLWTGARPLPKPFGRTWARCIHRPCAYARTHRSRSLPSRLSRPRS